MKRTINYSSIERVAWEFDEEDIRLALLKQYKIKEFLPNRRLEFEIYEIGDDGSHVAVVTVTYEKEKLEGE